MSFVSVSRVSLNHWFSGIWLCALECFSLCLSCLRFIELLASELTAFIKFWKFSAISSNIFFCYSFPHQSSSWESNYMYDRLLGIAHRSRKLLFFCFLNLFFLCAPFWILPIATSSNTLILSFAVSYLLLIAWSEFFTSDVVLFSSRNLIILKIIFHFSPQYTNIFP